MSEESEGDFNLLEAADELGESTDDVGTAESESLDVEESADSVEASIDSQAEGQPKSGAVNPKEAKTLTPEEVLAELEKQPVETASPELLKMLNGLGMSHKGMPINIKDENHLKELVQKGYDYTFDKMNHAEEVRHFQKEVQESKAKLQQEREEFQGQAKDYEDYKNKVQLFGALFQEIQAQDPGLFEDLDQRFRQHEGRFAMARQANSFQEQKFAALEKKLDQIAGQDTQKQMGEIRASWEREWGEIQTKTSDRLAKLGVHIDPKKVQQTWAADPSGKMTVQQALNATYGDQIIKAYESQKKLLSTKNKSMERNLGRTGGGSRASGAPALKIAAGDYNSILRAGSAEM